MKVKVKSFSWVRLFETQWTVAHQVPLTMGFFQTRTLLWVAVSYSRGSSGPRVQTYISFVSGINKQILYPCTTWEAPISTSQSQSWMCQAEGQSWARKNQAKGKPQHWELSLVLPSDWGPWPAWPSYPSFPALLKLTEFWFPILILIS